MLPVESPFKTFTGLDGKPLNNGYVYFGLPDQNPITAPVTVYWDAEGTVPAAQPLRTLNGYIVRAGTPANVFVDASYSEIVKDSKKRQVFYAQNSDDFSLSSIVNKLIGGYAAPTGADLIGYDNDGQTRTISSMLDQLLAGWVNAADPRFAGGAKGGQDSTAALQAAHAYAKQKYTSATVYLPPTSTPYKIYGTLNWDTNRVGWQGHGRVDCGGRTDDDFLNIVQSEPDINKRPALNALHPIEGMIFDGPGQNGTSARGTVINDSSPTHGVCGVTFRRGAFWNWKIGAYLGDGAFFTLFEDFEFGSPDGKNGGMNTSVFHPSGVINAGERNMFVRTRFSVADIHISQGNGNASTFLNTCSFNYQPGRAIYVGGGMVRINGGHIEANNDADYWMYVTGQNSALHVDGATLLISGPKSAKEIFYSDASCTNGGVHLNLGQIGGISPYTLSLIGGTGRMSSAPTCTYSSGLNPHIGAGCNLLAYGDFNSANFASEWVLAGPTPPALTMEESYSGNSPYSLKFSGINSQTNTARAIVDCQPGKQVSCKFWTKMKDYGVGGSFAVTLQYLDRGGNILFAGDVLVLSANTVDAGLITVSNFPLIAPAGTAKAAMFCSIFGISTGTPSAYLDVVEINVH